VNTPPRPWKASSFPLRCSLHLIQSPAKPGPLPTHLVRLPAPPTALQHAAAARRLRQTTETLTGLDIDKSHLAAAITTQAQAVSSTTSSGIAHDKATTRAVADGVPRTLTRVATKSGGADSGIAAFGPVALSNIDTSPVLAASLSKAMPLATTANSKQGASRGNTLPVPEAPAAKVTKAEPLGTQAAVGVTERASNAFSMSEMGDGPHAIAHAGEAVTSSWAGKDPEKFKLLPRLPRTPYPSQMSGGARPAPSAPLAAPALFAGARGEPSQLDGGGGNGGEDKGDEADKELTAADLRDVADAIEAP
jgi:hypothetical protein